MLFSLKVSHCDMSNTSSVISEIQTKTFFKYMWDFDFFFCGGGVKFNKNWLRVEKMSEMHSPRL